MKHPNFLTRLCLLALAVTLALPLIPAVAEEDAGNAPENPVVILSANPTTGYTWAVEIADEAVVSVTDDGIAPDSEELTGAGGMQRFELVGKAQGYTTVTFVYARSWETEEEPVYKLVYDLSVDADLKVTVAATTFIPGGN
ncbi:MAG TPA: protease inhibitor I42 family protein [Candidatus Limiplasma pullistercoris]|nr:protease inhibitor I42 family protein [Candidatus Limiplasma pullistercoris]